MNKHYFLCLFPSTEQRAHPHPCCRGDLLLQQRQLTAPTNCLHCTAAPYLCLSVNELHWHNYLEQPVQRERERGGGHNPPTHTHTHKKKWEFCFCLFKKCSSFLSESYRDTSISVTHCLSNNEGRNDRSNLLPPSPHPLSSPTTATPSFCRCCCCFRCQKDREEKPPYNMQ